jgi:protocatechuate 3,4-dioxygenase beta subunit
MMLNSPSRRIFLSTASAAGLILSSPAFARRLPITPSQAEGPFYPRAFPLDSDSDLIWVKGRSTRATGQVTYLTGAVLSLTGKPVSGARVEIWQCDAKGVYHHPGDRRGPADPNFQGYGRTLTDSKGAYRFRTIRPVSYPGRTPHIHVKVTPPGGRALTTQLYIKGERANARDFVLSQISNLAGRRSVIVPFVAAPKLERGAQRAEFTITLGGNAL